MFVELHLIQNFAPANLNRDDTNAPKDCTFGGYRRARISSQCIKRAIRWHPSFRASLEGHLADRSLRFPNDVKQALITGFGVDEKNAAEVANALRAIAKKEGGDDSKDSKSDDEIAKTPQLIFYPKAEVAECAKRIKALLDKGIKSTEVVKTLLDKKRAQKEKLSVTMPAPRSCDISLFGRMVTSDAFMNVDAACQVAQAISTNKVEMEFDYYTAIDDRQPKDEAGAGMMGTVEFNSSCFYRYANVSLEQLKKNLGDDEDLARKTLGAFLRASVQAIPTGKQNSMAAQNPPSFVMAVVRESGLWSLANAFEKPVRPGYDKEEREVKSLVHGSIEALRDYRQRLGEIYGEKSITLQTCICTEAVELESLRIPPRKDDKKGKKEADTEPTLERLVKEVLAAAFPKGAKP